MDAEAFRADQQGSANVSLRPYKKVVKGIPKSGLNRRIIRLLCA